MNFANISCSDWMMLVTRAGYFLLILLVPDETLNPMVPSAEKFRVPGVCQFLHFGFPDRSLQPNPFLLVDHNNHPNSHTKNIVNQTGCSRPLDIIRMPV